MLELLRNLGIIGKEWIYFVCKKDINFGEPGVECCYESLGPLIIHKLKLSPKVMLLGGWALRSWFDHKGRTLMSRISAFINEAPERSLVPFIT